jgi:hypothetical protein
MQSEREITSSLFSVYTRFNYPPSHLKVLNTLTLENVVSTSETHILQAHQFSSAVDIQLMKQFSLMETEGSSATNQKLSI